jgi:hypothetical protein
VLKANPGHPRTNYLTQAMDIMRNPIRNNLPIPWDRLKELGRVARVMVPDPVNAPSGPSDGRQSKRRKVEVKGKIQPPPSRRNENKKRVAIDGRGDVAVKMEEMSIEVSIIFHLIPLDNSLVDAEWGCIWRFGCHSEVV